jgi:hypothetical protein
MFRKGLFTSASSIRDGNLMFFQWDIGPGAAFLASEREFCAVSDLGKRGTLLRFAKQLKTNAFALQLLVRVQFMDNCR